VRTILVNASSSAVKSLKNRTLILHYNFNGCGKGFCVVISDKHEIGLVYVLSGQ
jgi:hypothetical protein